MVNDKYSSIRFFISIFVTGLSGLTAQILLLRELLIVFSGNELSIGIILANWLILESFGSFFLGRTAGTVRQKTETFVGLTILFSFSLPIAVYSTRMLRNILDISLAQELGFVPIFYSSFFILSLPSLLHGALFTYGCKMYSLLRGDDTSSVGKVYVYEIFGTVVGGIVVTYLLIPHLHSFHIVAVLGILNFLACALLLIPLWKTGKIQKGLALLCSILFLVGFSFLLFGWADRLHQGSIKKQWSPLNVVHYQNSLYGNLCVIENEGQYIFFSDGGLLMITPIPDIPFVEKFVHLPLLSHPHPKQALILGGGAGGIINEILQHQTVSSIEYAELDPLIIQLLKKFPTPLTENELNDPRVRVKHIDGRLFLKTTENRYDVIFVGVSRVSDLQTNRFFTREFFYLVQQRLNKHGIIVIGLPGSLTYLTDELKNLNSSVFHTMRSVFTYLRVFPAEGTNVFLASDSEEIMLLDTDQVINRLDERNLERHLPLPRHIEYKLHPGWTDWFSTLIEQSSQQINYDFRPIGLFYSFSHWNAIFTPFLARAFELLSNLNVYIFFVLFLVFVVFFLSLRMRFKTLLGNGIPFSVATTGTAGMVFDLALIFTFQAIYGFVFSWIGLLVSFFMAGAGVGAMKMTAMLPRIKNGLKIFAGFDLALLCLFLALPFIFWFFQAFLDVPAVFSSLKVVFLLLSFTGGFFVGAQFPLANQIYLKSPSIPLCQKGKRPKQRQEVSGTVGMLYGLDLFGGWVGGIVGGVILLPVLGLFGTCMVIVLLKLSSFIVVANYYRVTKFVNPVRNTLV